MRPLDSSARGLVPPYLGCILPYAPSTAPCGPDMHAPVRPLNSARVPRISNSPPDLDPLPPSEETLEPFDDAAIFSTVVDIFTTVGTLTLDGSSISFDEDGDRGLSRVFAQAGIGLQVEGTRQVQTRFLASLRPPNLVFTCALPCLCGQILTLFVWITP